jgi:hypothetical protein
VLIFQEFDANKAAGHYDANMGRVPILEVTIIP